SLSVLFVMVNLPLAGVVPMPLPRAPGAVGLMDAASKDGAWIPDAFSRLIVIMTMAITASRALTIRLQKCLVRQFSFRCLPRLDRGLKFGLQSRFALVLRIGL